MNEMKPTEQEIEALSKELYLIWRDAPYDAPLSFEVVARHVLSRPAPPDTIRLGTGLTEEQMSWNIEGKRDMAAKYDAVAAALSGFSWAATAEGAQWKAVRNRFSQIAADLRAAAEPPVDPRIAVVQDTIGQLARTGVPSTDEARAILAALDAAGGGRG